MLDYDVIICGGGPAGSTCALTLANSNLRVAVIEKSPFPRNKVCGDAIAAYVPKILESIYPGAAEALQAFQQKTVVDTCRIIAPNGKWVDVHSKEQGFISRRMDWDHFLYKLTSNFSNIKWHFGHKADEIAINKKEGVVTVVAGEKTFTSRLLIGCDGAHSVCSKQLTGQQIDTRHYSAAVRAYYQDVNGMVNGTYELFFIDHILPGYFWIFPLPGNQANVGLCIPSRVVSKKKINLRKTLNEIIAQHPVIAPRFSGAHLTSPVEGYGLPLGTNRKIIAGDRFMLCGDAASLIDPATGEGIGQSMISGRYAGWQAVRCFEENNFSRTFMNQYSKQLREKLQCDFRKSYVTQWSIFNHRRLFNACFAFLHRHASFTRFVLKNIVKVS